MTIAQPTLNENTMSGAGRGLKLLFVVEGFTDIRFISVLSEISDLTVLVPRRQFRSSGLDVRVRELQLPVHVEELEGSRLVYQAKSTAFLWANASRFNLILSQELLRGSLSATTVGRLRRIPVVTYMCLPPVEYFRCRRRRRTIGRFTAMTGEFVIKSLLTINGRLANACIALGPYLKQIAAKYSKQVESGLYYGVDTSLYCPCDPKQKRAIRVRHNLPLDKFLIFFSSRISHEKDPETVLRAAALARQRGLDCAVLNLSGGHEEFLNLAQSLGLPSPEKWVLARPPAHPMRDLPDFYRASDCLAQGSLEEGLGMSPLEALACGTPAVCTAVGGLKDHLAGYARLTPPLDVEAMALEFLWIHNSPVEARGQALLGRYYVERNWSREKAARDLKDVVQRLVADSTRA